MRTALLCGLALLYGFAVAIADDDPPPPPETSACCRIAGTGAAEAGMAAVCSPTGDVVMLAIPPSMDTAANPCPRRVGVGGRGGRAGLGHARAPRAVATLGASTS